MKNTLLKKLAVGASLFAMSLTAVGGATANDITPDDVIKQIQDQYQQTASIAQRLWDLAEVGYQETESSALLQKTLADAGFSIKAGVADIPTAFVAEYGSGGPIIGILAEFDALPGITQDATPVRKLIPTKAAGHACGHNLFGAGSTHAALALAKWLEETGTPGRVRLYGTPAEEGGSGKVYMVRAGLFDDVDTVIHWHAGDSNSAGAWTTLANRSAKFRFYGTSAHAAGAPDKARSSLDAVESMNYMVNMMREHVPMETRIHYVITEGGNAPNVTPDFAEVFYYLRHPNAMTVDSLWTRLEDAAKGAAMGTGTEVKWEIIHGNHAVVVNETLQMVMQEKLTKVGGVEYDAEEQKFAETIYESLNSPRLKLGSEKEIMPYSTGLGFGSTDVADVSIAVPTVGLRTATYVPGTAGHSWQAVAAAGTSIGFKGANNAAQAMTLMGIELFSNKELRDAARKEFMDRRGPNFKYFSLLGDRKPPLDYRK